jgi:cell division protein FtsL
MKNKYKILVGLLVSTLLASTIFASISSASKGSELLDIEEKLSEINEKNNSLRGEILSNSSLTTIQKKAHEMGFVENKEKVFVTINK